MQDKYPIEIRGRSGKSLGEYYKEQGGPTAYLGSTVPDFPNFMLISGNLNPVCTEAKADSHYS